MVAQQEDGPRHTGHQGPAGASMAALGHRRPGRGDGFHRPPILPATQLYDRRLALEAYAADGRGHGDDVCTRRGRCDLYRARCSLERRAHRLPKPDDRAGPGGACYRLLMERLSSGESAHLGLCRRDAFPPGGQSPPLPLDGEKPQSSGDWQYQQITNAREETLPPPMEECVSPIV